MRPVLVTMVVFVWAGSVSDASRISQRGHQVVEHQSNGGSDRSQDHNHGTSGNSGPQRRKEKAAGQKQGRRHRRGRRGTSPLDQVKKASKPIEDRKLLLAAARQVSGSEDSGPDVLQYASPSLQGDRELVRALIEIHDRWYDYNLSPLKYASDTLKDDKDLVMLAVATHAVDLQFASARLQADREVVSKAVMGNECDALEFASEELKDDTSFVADAMNSGCGSDGIVYACDALRFASPRLRNDKAFVKEAMLNSENTGCIKYASEELQNDDQFKAEVKAEVLKYED